jgi:pyruvate dehydrogenase E1 component
MYLLRDAGSPRSRKPRVQLLGSGTILREVIAAASLLKDDFGVLADVWSVTSFTELRRDGIEAERWNMLHPVSPPREAFVSASLAERRGPVVASTDYVRTFADQIRQWVPRRYSVLGTDGYGRSDFRSALRAFFEVDRRYVAVAALKALADDGEIEREIVQQAIERYEIDPEAPIPTSV